ncbi:MAG: glycosyltransferase [Devosia sp.]|uniref:glycosyltransferase n=1 Tax=Devosia sp. TaxID=1871048 RepID=UPI001A528666|nr:glycosyltransferase [Devosia sp.]MBL8599246.1 glycosyltransferase [Devosia sp.]
MLSVVVCTLNRHKHLADCLAALGQQTASAADFEVLVVDNGSTDETAIVAKAWASGAGNRKYIHEPVMGLSKARNTGLRECSGDLVAYTDDDARATPAWVSGIIARFDQLPPTFAALGGEIDPVFESPRPGWLTDGMLHNYSVSLRWSEVPRTLAAHEWICEANCAYRTEILRRYGGFPERLGRQGAALLSGENFVNELMRKDGLQFYFDPTIRVDHLIPSSRLTKAWMRRRYFWGGVTAALLPAAAAERGFTHDRYPSVRPPLTPEEWVRMLDDSDEGFELSCARLSEVGYLLGTADAVVG